MIVLTQNDIEDLNIKNSEILRWVKEAFLIKERSYLPEKISQTFNNGNNFFNTMPVIVPSIDSAGVKYVSRYPNRNPAIRGELLLYNLSDGLPLALMDATWITAKRTGAVAALAVSTFAKKDFENIALLGLGETGRSFIDMCLLDTENKEKTFKLMSYKDHAVAMQKHLYSQGVKKVEICNSYEELIRNSDVIVSAITVAKEDIGKDEWFKKGVLVVPIHTRGFQNCDLFFDKVFGDDTAHLSNFKYFDRFRSFNEIDKVLKHEIIGRSDDSERILSYNIGIALHDIYIARKIYNLNFES